MVSMSSGCGLFKESGFMMSNGTPKDLQLQWLGCTSHSTQNLHMTSKQVKHVNTVSHLPSRYTHRWYKKLLLLLPENNILVFFTGPLQTWIYSLFFICSVILNRFKHPPVHAVQHRYRCVCFGFYISHLLLGQYRSLPVIKYANEY